VKERLKEATTVNTFSEKGRLKRTITVKRFPILEVVIVNSVRDDK
jgi:hypothetical protein